MNENPNRILLLVTLAVLIIGGIVLYVQHVEKTRTPVIGWYSLGTETFDLKPSAYRGFSYRDVPPKFRVELHASAPVAFGFVTPDVYGHYTSTPMQIEFATLPCGSGQTTSVDLNCNTEPSKRYLLLTDAREDTVPEPATRKGRAQPVSQSDTPSQPDNHVTITMYDWRCLRYCENLPRS
jgi:hypothetical protein